MVYERCVEFPDLGWMLPDGLHYDQPGLNDMGTVGGTVVATTIMLPPSESTLTVDGLDATLTVDGLAAALGVAVA